MKPTVAEEARRRHNPSRHALGSFLIHDVAGRRHSTGESLEDQETHMSALSSAPADPVAHEPKHGIEFNAAAGSGTIPGIQSARSLSPTAKLWNAPRGLEPLAAPAEVVAICDPAVWSLIEESRRFRERLDALAKDTIDVVGAVILLLSCLPLCMVIAVAIKITSPGPVLFRHRRLGQNGREFWCYKFRTMVQDAEGQLAGSERLRAEFEANFKIKSDPRITPLGALLRRISLDELPQFWNVLRRDMSLIGPRPIVPTELAKYGPYGPKLLTVMPGIGGLWQAHGRSDTNYAQRIQMDMLYIDHRSTWLDLKLLFLTFMAALNKTGAC